MRIPKRAGLVELFVEVKGRSHANLPDALMASIRHDADARRSDVLNILKDPRTTALDPIVFPGWTLVGTTLPAEIIKAAKGRTVVIELLLPASRTHGKRGKAPSKATSSKATKRPESTDEPVPWRTYVIHRGAPLGPFVQRIITSSDAGSGTTPSRWTREFANELRRGGRSWSTGSALWICGEVNALYGRGQRIEPWVDDLRTNWALIANPAHTPTKLQAMRDKRAHLSSSGVLLTTANTHGPWRDSAGNRCKAGWRAAAAYEGGLQIGSEGKKGMASSTFDVGNHRVIVVERP